MAMLVQTHLTLDSSRGDTSSTTSIVPTAAYPTPPSASPTYELIPHRVFVGGFASVTTETDLRLFFEKYGHVREAKVIRNPEGTSKGYGFVTFDTEDEAQKIRNLASEHLELKGRRLNLGPAMRKVQQNTKYNDFSVATPAAAAVTTVPIGRRDTGGAVTAFPLAVVTPPAENTGGTATPAAAAYAVAASNQYHHQPTLFVVQPNASALPYAAAASYAYSPLTPNVQDQRYFYYDGGQQSIYRTPANATMMMEKAQRRVSPEKEFGRRSNAEDQISPQKTMQSQLNRAATTIAQQNKTAAYSTPLQTQQLQWTTTPQQQMVAAAYHQAAQQQTTVFSPYYSYANTSVVPVAGTFQPPLLASTVPTSATDMTHYSQMMFYLDEAGCNDSADSTTLQQRAYCQPRTHYDEMNEPHEDSVAANKRQTHPTWAIANENWDNAFPSKIDGGGDIRQQSRFPKSTQQRQNNYSNYKRPAAPFWTPQRSFPGQSLDRPRFFGNGDSRNDFGGRGRSDFRRFDGPRHTSPSVNRPNNSKVSYQQQSGGGSPRKDNGGFNRQMARLSLNSQQRQQAGGGSVSSDGEHSFAYCSSPIQNNIMHSQTHYRPVVSRLSCLAVEGSSTTIVQTPPTTPPVMYDGQGHQR